MRCVSVAYESLSIVGVSVCPSIDPWGKPHLYMLWKLSMKLTKLRCQYHNGCNNAQQNGAVISQKHLHEAQIYMQKSILLREM